MTYVRYGITLDAVWRTVVASRRATHAGVVRADDLTFGFEIVEDLIMDGANRRGDAQAVLPGAGRTVQPANSALTPLIVPADEVRIQGTVVAVLRDV